MSRVDELAQRLWVAKERARPVAAEGDWLGVDHRTALEIADRLYRRCAVPSDPREVAAWKMGALDEPTQNRLGLPGPLTAPVLPDGLHTGVGALPVRLAELVDAKLEAEIGVLLEAEGARLVPCVEIADCRFAGWAVPPGCAAADFGLQGAMVFGAPVAAPVEDVQVTVRHDGATVAGGSGNWTAAAAGLSLLPAPLGSAVHVATGAITAMLPAAAGRWEFDFGAAGTIVLDLA
jgi:2-keto-4-pentenoate hydratase